MDDASRSKGEGKGLHTPPAPSLLVGVDLGRSHSWLSPKASSFLQASGHSPGGAGSRPASALPPTAPWRLQKMPPSEEAWVGGSTLNFLIVTVFPEDFLMVIAIPKMCV